MADVKVDKAGLGQVMKSREVAAAVEDLAQKVAGNINARGLSADSAGQSSGSLLRAEVDTYTTDRAAAAVWVKHPAALAMQARHGLFTRAAADAGMEVKSR